MLQSDHNFSIAFHVRYLHEEKLLKDFQELIRCTPAKFLCAYAIKSLAIVTEWISQLMSKTTQMSSCISLSLSLSLSLCLSVSLSLSLSLCACVRACVCVCVCLRYFNMAYHDMKIQFLHRNVNKHHFCDFRF